MATIDLIVLGILKKESLSAYDIQKLVEYRNISRWVKISTPSIYKKVIQLEEKGLINSVTVKEGKMPEKAGVQNSSDNPRKNIMTVCLNYKAATDWGMQYLFSASLIYYREKRNGTFSDWVQIK